jgi:GT2 family glycosyltransferase
LLDEGEAIVAGAVRSKYGSLVHSEIEPREVSDGNYLREFSNLNVALDRQVFDSIGSFDEQLGFAEDVDLAWRATDAGLAIRFASSALIDPDWGSFRDDLSRALRYGVGQVRLYRKHRARRRSLFHDELFLVVYSSYLLLSPIALVFPAYLMILVIPLVLNPRRHPFPTVLYQFVMSAGILSELFHIPLLRSQRREH